MHRSRRGHRSEVGVCFVCEVFFFGLSSKAALSERFFVIDLIRRKHQICFVEQSRPFRAVFLSSISFAANIKNSTYLREVIKSSFGFCAKGVCDGKFYIYDTDSNCGDLGHFMRSVAVICSSPCGARRRRCAVEFDARSANSPVSNAVFAPNGARRDDKCHPTNSSRDACQKP